jgi:hypothetical protein
MDTKVTANEAFWAVQLLEEVKTADEAVRLLTTLKATDGFVGGRLIPPAGKGWWMEEAPPEIWKVQVLYLDCGPDHAAALPEGMKRVLVLPCMFRTFGIKTEGET